MISQPGQGPTLVIVAHGAQNLLDVEAIGKQDPYLQFTLDINNPKSFQKTFVHKDAGKTPTWNQSFSLPLAGEPELFVEIMDEETTADAVIAFAAIPINQVVHAPGGTFNGIFPVYLPSGKQQGELNLTLTAHNVPGQNTGQAAPAAHPVQGTSHISEAHQKRVKSLKSREAASDAGMAIGGGLLAVGVGLLANKFANDNKKEEEAKKAAERHAQEERERFELEKKKLEQDRANFAHQQQQPQQHQQHQQPMQHQQPLHQGGYPQGHGGHHDDHHGKKDKHDKKDKHKKDHSDSSDSSDSDDDHKKDKGKKKWDGHGRSYSPGDKVKYDGDKYVCLQAHSSQPDWTPTAAHSLWKRK
ncbi:hypothetical protein BGZ70_010247 [Mortierella alpina]|uniref:C2 domain-containing protein n=1 Tax=Mortierella alpina TaxID=64518 RepID=A0A9P6LZU8_MORAP|nr:hypothetical protein BGZ70_010247 [Mortierella alpina]